MEGGKWQANGETSGQIVGGAYASLRDPRRGRKVESGEGSMEAGKRNGGIVGVPFVPRLTIRMRFECVPAG